MLIGYLKVLTFYLQLLIVYLKVLIGYSEVLIFYLEVLIGCLEVLIGCLSQCAYQPRGVTPPSVIDVIPTMIAPASLKRVTMGSSERHGVP